MGNAKHASTDVNARESEPRSQSTLSLIATMADTTWRMFLPTVGLLLVGNALDDRYHTAPWLLLVGVICGGGIATLLVRQQLQRGKSS